VAAGVGGNSLVSNGRDGKPIKNSILKGIEVDAVEMLRTPGTNGKAMKARLSARLWLLQHGWTVEQVNKAKGESK
jgi:hypothetical protein